MGISKKKQSILKDGGFDEEFKYSRRERRISSDDIFWWILQTRDSCRICRII